MSNAPIAPAPAPARTTLPLAQAAKALAHPMRWRILAALSEGEPLMAVELAQRLGRAASVISKHLWTLRQTGAVVLGRARMSSVPAHFQREPGVLDFGYGPMRLGGSGGAE